MEMLYDKDPVAFKAKYGNFASGLQEGRVNAQKAGQSTFNYKGKPYQSGVTPEKIVGKTYTPAPLPMGKPKMITQEQIDDMTKKDLAGVVENKKQPFDLSSIPSIAELVARQSILNKGANTQLDLQKRTKEDSEANLQISKQQQQVDSRRNYLKVMESDREETVNKILADRLKITKLLLDENNSGGAGKTAAMVKTSEAKDLSGEYNAKLYQSIINQLNDFETTIGAKRDENLRNLLSTLAQGTIGIKEYEQQRKEIVLKSEDEIYQEQIKYLNFWMNIYGMSEENQIKIREKYTDLYNKETKKRYEADEAIVLGNAKLLQENIDKAEDIKLKKAKKTADLQKDMDEKVERQKRALIEETSQFMFTLIDAQTQKKIDS